MVRNVNIALDDRNYEEINRVKEELGLTWEEFIVQAADCLDEHGTEE